MSYNRIDLYGKGYCNIFFPTGMFRLDEFKGNTLTIREIANMHTLPRFVIECMKYNVKPLCAVSFMLNTPKECLVDAIEIVCYPVDMDGCDELNFLCCRSRRGFIEYEDFCKFSNHLQIGISTVYDGVTLLVIDNVFKTVFVPDFLIVDFSTYEQRCWQHSKNIIESNNVLICIGGYFTEQSDEELLKEYGGFGKDTYKYLIENPQKIADRILGNYKFRCP